MSMLLFVHRCPWRRVHHRIPATRRCGRPQRGTRRHERSRGRRRRRQALPGCAGGRAAEENGRRDRDGRCTQRVDNADRDDTKPPERTPLDVQVRGEEGPKDCIVQRNGRIAQPAGLHRVHHQLLPSRRSVQKLVGARGRRADACHAAVDLRLREQLPAGRPQQALIRHPQQAVAHRGCHDERDAHCPGRVSAATNEANAPVRQATNTAHDEASSHERNCGAAPAAERPPQQHGLRGGGAQLARCRAHHHAESGATLCKAGTVERIAQHVQQPAHGKIAYSGSVLVGWMAGWLVGRRVG
mmetsp:Transcript_9169/g.27918  ORF Transcript_9169/g.27918 Transcript_9169/m.27918 type:complete len:299 (-) Transcript_9169:252-1148(-)